ncbi:MAG: chromosome partitioning protein [Actinomycetota bacterium]|nr:chromosome partitioning protein [Actinomycetota bacterium]
MKTLATYSIKGGVGKTTAAVNIAYEAARSGVRVLLWDLDPQGAATFFFRVKPFVRGGAKRLIGAKRALVANLHATDHPGLDLVPADFSLRHLDLYLDDAKRPTRRLARLLEPLSDRYDLAVLDCPPGITLTSESVFSAADALLVPTIPTPLSKRTLDQLSEFLADYHAPPAILPFASIVDRRKKLQREIADALAAQTSGFLPTAIPNSSALERMGVEQAPIATYAPNNPAAIAFRHLWSDVLARLWN